MGGSGLDSLVFSLAADNVQSRFQKQLTGRSFESQRFKGIEAKLSHNLAKNTQNLQSNLSGTQKTLNNGTS